MKTLMMTMLAATLAGMSSSHAAVSMAPLPALTFGQPGMPRTLNAPVLGVAALDDSKFATSLRWQPFMLKNLPATHGRRALQRLLPTEVALSPFGAFSSLPGDTKTSLRLGAGASFSGFSVAGYAVGQELDTLAGRLQAEASNPVLAQALTPVLQGRLRNASRQGGGVQVGWSTELSGWHLMVAAGREETATLRMTGWSPKQGNSYVVATLSKPF